MRLDVMEIAWLNGAIVPATRAPLAQLKKWAKKAGVNARYVKSVKDPATGRHYLSYVDTEAMGVNAHDFVDDYSVGFKSVKSNPVKPLQEHYNHDIRQLTVRENGKYLTKWYVYDDKEKKDIPKLFDTERQAIIYSRQLGKKQEPGFYKTKPKTVKATPKKCACTVKTRKKGERLPWVIGILNGKQKGYFDGTGFDTDPGKAVLFVTQENAVTTAKTIKGLPKGVKLFVTKKPLGAVGAPIIK